MKKEKQMDNINFKTKVIETKPDKDGSTTATLLIDDKGYICGVYADEATAEAAMPNVRSNVLRGRLIGKPLRPVYNSNKRM